MKTGDVNVCDSLYAYTIISCINVQGAH